MVKQAFVVPSWTMIVIISAVDTRILIMSFLINKRNHWFSKHGDPDHLNLEKEKDGITKTSKNTPWIQLVIRQMMEKKLNTKNDDDSILFVRNDAEVRDEEENWELAGEDMSQVVTDGQPPLEEFVQNSVFHQFPLPFEKIIFIDNQWNLAECLSVVSQVRDVF